VITHLEIQGKSMEGACNPDDIKKNISSMQTSSQVEEYLDELVRFRTEINKNAIICEKLKTGA
jgi:hypothetical protein